MCFFKCLGYFFTFLIFVRLIVGLTTRGCLSLLFCFSQRRYYREQQLRCRETCHVKWVFCCIGKHWNLSRIQRRDPPFWPLQSLSLCCETLDLVHLSEEVVAVQSSNVRRCHGSCQARGGCLQHLWGSLLLFLFYCRSNSPMQCTRNGYHWASVSKCQIWQ